MEDYNRIQIENISLKLTKEQDLTNKILSLAMIAGTLVFFAITVVINLLNSQQNNITDFSKILVNIFFAIAAIMYAFNFFYNRYYIKSESFKNIINNNNTLPIEDRLISAARNLMLIRLAMLEGVSFFGLVIIMIVTRSGEIKNHNEFYLLTLPILIQVLVTFKKYFSKEKFIESLNNDILTPLKNLQL